MIETIFILALMIGLFWNYTKRPKNFPPGPVPLPLIGNLLNLDHTDIQSSVESLSHKYGDIVGLVVPKYKAVIVNGWEAIIETFANENFQGRPDACLIRDRFNGENYGILFSEGEQWKTQRRFALHHFRNLGFGRKSHESVIIEEVQSLAEEIKSLNGSPIVIEHMVGVSAINITWCLLGGKRYNRSDEILNNLVNDVKGIVHGVKIIGSPAVYFPFIRYLFPELTGYNAIKKGSYAILQFIKAAVEEHKKTLTTSDQNDFISIYLNKMALIENQCEDSSFYLEMLEGICTDLLTAGSDTTSSAISYAVLYLCLEQECQEKMYQEILNVVGKDSSPCYEDKAKLVYTEAFLSECMRFRPPVPTPTPHTATRDSSLHGYDIPKGTVFIINLKSIFSDREYWGDPETFRPERFITEDGKIRRSERLISFGKGKRSCIGEGVAKMTTFLTVTSLVQKFKLSFPDGEIPTKTEGTYDFTLAPPDYRVIATPR